MYFIYYFDSLSQGMKFPSGSIRSTVVLPNSALTVLTSLWPSPVWNSQLNRVFKTLEPCLLLSRSSLKVPEMLSVKKTMKVPVTQLLRFWTMNPKTTMRASTVFKSIQTCWLRRYSNVFLGLALLELGDHDKSEQVPFDLKRCSTLAHSLLGI